MACYPFELLPSEGGRARVWLRDPVERLGFGPCGSRGSPCLGESILLTSSWPFLTIGALPASDSCQRLWQDACRRAAARSWAAGASHENGVGELTGP